MNSLLKLLINLFIEEVSDHTRLKEKLRTINLTNDLDGVIFTERKLFVDNLEKIKSVLTKTEIKKVETALVKLWSEDQKEKDVFIASKSITLHDLAFLRMLSKKGFPLVSSMFGYLKSLDNNHLEKMVEQDNLDIVG